MYTRRLNQDCLENFFSSLRQKVGNCSYPIQFFRAYKQLFCVNYLDHSDEANCADDMDHMLTSITNNAGNTQLLTVFNRNDINQQITLQSTSITDYRNNLPAANALKYVCGYLIRKCLEVHSCEVCTAFAKEESTTFDNTTIFQSFKAYPNKNCDMFGNLMTPNNDFYTYIQKLENTFLDNFLTIIERQVANSLITIMKNIQFSHPCSDFPKMYLLKLFVRMRIFYCLQFLNRDINTKAQEKKSNKKQPTKNLKLMKLQHL